MKSIATFLCIILTFLISIPASYSQFKLVDPDNEWDILYTFGYDHTIRYTFSEDSTLIEGKYYHELLKTNLSTGPIDVRTDNYYRQEGGKVWAMVFAGTTTFLLYVFSLEVGDTFVNRESGDYIITVKDTIFFRDGSERKHFILEQVSYPDCDIEWYEGMGSLVGFMNDLHTCGVDAARKGDLLCFKYDGKLLYDNPEFDSCYIYRDDVSIESYELSNLKLYPNPTTDKLSIKTDYKIESVEIYNLMAQKIREIHSPRSSIDISNLSSGVYIIHITTVNGYYGVRKFVRE